MQVPPIAGFLQKFDSNALRRTKPVANYRQHSNAAIRIEAGCFTDDLQVQLSSSARSKTILRLRLRKFGRWSRRLLFQTSERRTAVSPLQPAMPGQRRLGRNE